jgi:hypothetical protein
MKQVRLPMKDPRNYYERVLPLGPTSLHCRPSQGPASVGPPASHVGLLLAINDLGRQRALLDATV